MSTQNIQDSVNTLKEKFDRALMKLGPKREQGTMRYNFEVDFCYITRELDDSPSYMHVKLLEQGNELYTKLTNLTKLTNGSST